MSVQQPPTGIGETPLQVAGFLQMLRAIREVRQLHSFTSGIGAGPARFGMTQAQAAGIGAPTTWGSLLVAVVALGRVRTWTDTGFRCAS